MRLVLHYFLRLSTWLTPRPVPVPPTTRRPKRHPRGRFLLPVEWARVRLVLDRQPVKVRVYFYVLMLEGPRRSELQRMEWAHIDLEAGYWYNKGDYRVTENKS